MKRILFLNIAILICSIAFSQVPFHEAPISPELLNYLKANKGSTKSSDSKSDLLNIFSFSPIKITEPSYSPVQLHLKSFTTDQPKFDLRDKIALPTVRSQGDGENGGNCWAFSTMSSIESALIIRKKTTDTIDFSEQNLAACHGYEWKYGEGGNERLSMAYLTRLDGPYKENDDQYKIAKNVTCKTINSKPFIYVPEVRWIYHNPKLTKIAIQNYGAVTCNISWQDNYYSLSTFSLLYSGKQDVNHQISLIGWDDNKLINGIRGAWIARNSWGISNDNKMNNGYFYISYLDSKILWPAASYPTIWKNTEIDTIYYYDKLGPITAVGYMNNTSYALVKFVSGGNKYIKYVGTFAYASASVIDIEVYTRWNLTNKIASSYNNTCPTPGFYTFNVGAFVADTFYVKIKYFTPNYNYPIPVEKTLTQSQKPYAKAELKPKGFQWMSADGKKWDALGSDIKHFEMDLSIKAYASNNSNLKASFVNNKQQSCVGGNVLFTDTSNILSGKIKSWKWDFGQKATPRYATTKGPHNVTYSDSAGVRTVKLEISDSITSDTFTKEIFISDQIINQIVATKTKLRAGIDTADIISIVQGSSYNWTANTTGLLDNNSNKVRFTSTTKGEYNIKLNIQDGSNCKSTDSIMFTVGYAPSNDIICNAKSINTFGQKLGPFNNRFAGVETSEPAPSDTNCYSLKTWCREGGLQNSVWFKFTAPDSIISIISEGFDTQMALYQAKDCNSVIANKIDSLVAANDDFYNIAPFAASLSNAKVTKGKIYYLQLDGSNYGAEGDFYLTLNNGNNALNINHIQVSDNFEIKPNPNNGVFEIIISSNNTSFADIEIFNITGNKVADISHLKIKDNLRIPLNIDIPNGLYMIKLTFENKKSITKKLMIRK